MISTTPHDPRWVVIFVSLVALSLGTVTFAHAQESDDPTVIAAARALAIEGVKLAQSEHCPEAIDKLERAEKLHHAPIVLAHLGDCYIKGGRLVEGVERLRAVIREPLPANPSEALQQAYDDAKARLEETKPKLAMLTVTVAGAPPDTELTLVIDERPVPAALVGAPQLIDPGAHLIKLGASGYQTSVRNLTMSPGDSETLAMQLVALPNRPRGPNDTTSTAAADPSREPLPAARGQALQADASVSQPWPAYVAWGGSAVALGVGIGFGVAAISTKSRLSELCPAKMCPSEQADLLDTGRRNATISTVAYSVALGTAVLGTVLYLMRDRPDQPTTGQARGPRLDVGPLGVTLAL
jgi:hypothetical protein